MHKIQETKSSYPIVRPMDFYCWWKSGGDRACTCKEGHWAMFQSSGRSVANFKYEPQASSNMAARTGNERGLDADLNAISQELDDRRMHKAKEQLQQWQWRIGCTKGHWSCSKILGFVFFLSVGFVAPINDVWLNQNNYNWALIIVTMCFCGNKWSQGQRSTAVYVYEAS